MTLFQGNRALLEDFRKGEASALREVYCHYVKKIERFVSGGWYDPQRNTKFYGLADFELQAELIQEVFLRAFSEKGRLSYDGVRSYKAFILSIARNVIVDYVRKKPRDALSHAGVELDSPDCDMGKAMKSEETPCSESELDWQRCLNATADFVKSLNDRERCFLELRFQQELSLLEAARRIGVSRGKARHMEKSLGRCLKRYLQTRNLTLGWGNR